METNKYLKGNKLIAKFMGYEYIPYVKGQTQSPGWWHKKSPNIIKGKMPSTTKLSTNYFLCRRHHELRYCNEWNWLMPVVEKISKMKDVWINLIPKLLSENKTSCYIEVAFIRPRAIFSFKEDSLIESTYKAVVEFIKWYNNEKS